MYKVISRSCEEITGILTRVKKQNILRTIGHR